MERTNSGSCLLTVLLAAAMAVGAGCGSAVGGGGDEDADVVGEGMEGSAEADGDAAEDARTEGEADGEADGEVPPAWCGDGIADLQLGEECDDGNDTPGDGCEDDCLYTCHAAEDCDDENECTRNACLPGGTGRICIVEPAVGDPCDDGNPCTEGDTCDAGGACASGANVCPCAVDADCAAHEDGDLCNGTLVCVARSCEIDPATLVTCDTSGDTDCRASRCVPATGACEMRDRPDGRPCSDGQWCTPSDACASGACVGAGVRCPFPCQVCDEAARTCAVAAGWCLIAGECVAGGAVNPANPCEACRPDVNGAAWTSAAAGAACDDGFFCNGPDACNASGACVNVGPAPCAAGGCVAGCDEFADACVPTGAGTVCRPASGDCDVAETCSGTSTSCPADAVQPAGTVCRAAVPGGCDVQETCNGVANACPADAVQPVGTVCRAAVP
ncbi:MAG: hypothetical protein QME96_17000, partial [Myxococcota bacterium]|nr:hypothetical protein [Myxococcota bacterium]